MRFLSAFSLSTNSKTAWTSKREREREKKRERQTETERALEGRKRKRCFGAMCVVFKKDCRVLQKRDAFFFKVFFFFVFVFFFFKFLGFRVF